MVTPLDTVADTAVLAAPKQIVSPTGAVGAAMIGHVQFGAVTGRVTSHPVVLFEAVNVTFVPAGMPVIVLLLTVPPVLVTVPLLTNVIENVVKSAEHVVDATLKVGSGRELIICVAEAVQPLALVTVTV